MRRLLVGAVAAAALVGASGCSFLSVDGKVRESVNAFLVADDLYLSNSELAPGAEVDPLLWEKVGKAREEAKTALRSLVNPAPPEEAVPEVPDGE